MSTYDFKFCFALKRLQKSLEENVLTVFEKNVYNVAASETR